MSQPAALPLPVARSVASLRQTVADWRKAGLRIGFVPTMGALHAGHLSLVERAKERADRVVVSIFVNPTQFGPSEDFSKYPRQEASDAARLAAFGVDLLYSPSVAEMYPAGAATTVSVGIVTERLEGVFRPTHFDGVATVVAKLLNQVQPHVAVFGEKDYQQLLVVKRLVSDLDIDSEIVPGPTVREADGLAMSSRNAYLSDEDRAIAASLPATLNFVATQLRSGVDAAPILEAGRIRLMKAGFREVQYLDLADASTLAPLERADRPARLLVAALVGATRLIDNMAV
ncbi:pantoate--beta-alanine ligase [Zavarzinia aquatilis]|uniref:Pantothenate synthetase n=1 Tax=Zavarzinia aquatilis TaxID=2211142 RepID=A0A317DVM7_9PROT|nr:pantoate--beta-alanine ligase [Zavarzinia aquatilis]PWR18462.1 pantoate--beta-alanine ligase [Zavarzinia aquatilis]